MLKKLDEISRNIFFKNVGKKILAITIAVFLWFIANVEHDIEKSLSINVNYVNLPSDLVIVNKPPEKLNIRIRGSRTQLSSISPRNIAFTVDLANASPGLSKFEVQTDQIKTPRGVLVTGITPAEIKVDIDKLMVKEVDVRPVIEGPADTGYEVVGVPTVDPSKVEIRGPRSIVSKVERLNTDSISVVGVRSKFTIQVPLKPVNPLVDVVKDEIVRVTVDIQEQIVEKQFKNIDIKLVNFDDREVEPLGPMKAELEFEGPYSIIRDLNSDDINVYVDGHNLKNSQQKRVELQIDVIYPHPELITLKKKTPKVVEVKLN
ncbi:MAG TPA: CdaR family protein [Thermodesulfobacteriota bacterium]|nr:CdaR family protein [Thermodesulfobacteriota bacterium]